MDNSALPRTLDRMDERAAAIEARIRALGTPERAAGSARYFKTKPGEYGEGDIFAGLTLAQVHALEKELWKSTSHETILALLASPIHEARTTALGLWVRQYEKGDEALRERIYADYLAHTPRINNWDLVDLSAPGIVGAHLFERPRGILRKLAQSPILWERRIAIIATLFFIRRDDFADALEIATILKGDREDLLHKAAGWMLREVGKRDESVLRSFLDEHAATLPRTALRYSLERMDAASRAHYMALGKKRAAP